MLLADTIHAIREEMREEFHIPPFVYDTVLERWITESDAHLNMLVDNINYDEDLVARELLKNRTYFAYNGRANQFDTDFAQNVLTWQMNKINGVTNDGSSVY